MCVEQPRSVDTVGAADSHSPEIQGVTGAHAAPSLAPDHVEPATHGSHVRSVVYVPGCASNCVCSHSVTGERGRKAESETCGSVSVSVPVPVCALTIRPSHTYNHSPCDRSLSSTCTRGRCCWWAPLSHTGAPRTPSAARTPEKGDTCTARERRETHTDTDTDTQTQTHTKDDWRWSR